MEVSTSEPIDVGTYNIGSLIAHGLNKSEQTLENAITTIYGTLEHKTRVELKESLEHKKIPYTRAIDSEMIPPFGVIKDRLFSKLFEKTFIISACNFNNVCLSSSAIENIHESNRSLQNVFKISLGFYKSIYGEQQALYYSRLVLRLIQAFYYFYGLEKYIKGVEEEVNTNLVSRYNLNVRDPNDLYLIQIYTHVAAHSTAQVKYIKSVLSGVSSVLTDLDKIMQFIDVSKDTIYIIQKVFENLPKFIHFMQIVNAKKSILEIDTVMASFGLHTVTKSTSVKNINLTDPIRLGRGLHLSNIQNIDNDIVIATDDELDKMINEYPSMKEELIQKYISHPFMPINMFDLMSSHLIDIIKTEKITNAHILLLMLLLNYDNDNLIILLDISCNGADTFDDATCGLRAPSRRTSWPRIGGKTNKNKQKKNLKKKKTVNKRKQRRKPTYA
jgi:hypothetical protein